MKKLIILYPIHKICFFILNYLKSRLRVTFEKWIDFIENLFASISKIEYHLENQRFEPFCWTAYKSYDEMENFTDLTSEHEKLTFFALFGMSYYFEIIAVGTCKLHYDKISLIIRIQQKIHRLLSPFYRINFAYFPLNDF